MSKEGVDSKVIQPMEVEARVLAIVVFALGT